MSESDTPPGAEDPETTAGNLAAWHELDQLSIPEMFAKISEMSEAAKSLQDNE